MRTGACITRRRASRFQSDRNVFYRGFPRKERVCLKQISGLAIERGQRTAEDVDAAGSGCE
jgi:hypothetical protein